MTRIEQKWGLCQTLKSNLSRMKTPVVFGRGDMVLSLHEKIMVLKGIECDLKLLNGEIDELAGLAQGQNADGIKAKLRQIRIFGTYIRL